VVIARKIILGCSKLVSKEDAGEESLVAHCVMNYEQPRSYSMFIDSILVAHSFEQGSV
jgi:hypothetical protein